MSHAMPKSALGSNPGYSTLEYNPDAPGQYEDDLPQVAEHPPGRFAEQLPLGRGNAEVYSAYNDHMLPQVAGMQDKSQEPAPRYEGGAEYNQPGEKATKPAVICGLPRRRFWIIAGVVLGIIIVAAVVGGAVGGTVGDGGSDKARNSTEASTSNSSATSTSVAPYPSATASDYTGLRQNSSLATLAFDGGDAGLQYRVYYQDENALIKESAFDTSTNTWTVSVLDYRALSAKPGSAIAATATGSDGNAQLEVFYIDENEFLHELVFQISATDGPASGWVQGFADGRNYTADPNSKLQAIFDDCGSLCGGQLLWFWQDQDQNIRIGNSSNLGLQDAVITRDAPSGTGLAVSAWGVADVRQNYQLFWQSRNNTLMRYLWDPTSLPSQDYNTTGQGWSQTQSLGPVSSTPGSIASYTYGRTYPNYNPQSMQIFNSFEHGINVTYWLGTDGPTGTWEGSTTPEVFANITAYSAVAANSARMVFAIQDGVIQQFTVGDDGLTWSLVGTVPTK